MLAKYRQGRGQNGPAHPMSTSFSHSNIENPANNLVASIREKNSRNIEKFGEKAIVGSNSIVELPENHSQNLITSDNIKGQSVHQNMSFDVNHKQRLFKPKKKKDEATKALLNFEDMKRKILKDYVKKNNKELNNNVVQPSHHRNGGGLISNYLSQLDDYERNKEKSRSNEADLIYSKDSSNMKKKSSKKANKEKLTAIYEGVQSHWTNNQPLTQKSINTNQISSSKERPLSNKRSTPSKKSQPKTAIGNKRKSRSNMIDLSNSYVPTHKSTKSSGVTASGKINTVVPGSKKTKATGENKYSKDKFMYKERSYEALIKGSGGMKGVDVGVMQEMLAQKKTGMSFLASKMNKISFMN